MFIFNGIRNILNILNMKKNFIILSLVLINAILIINIIMANIQMFTLKSWNVIKTDSSYLVFDDNSRINTKLFDLKYLETIKDNKGNPYFIISGRTCYACDENSSIIVYSLEDTAKSLKDIHKYTYPGEIYDYLTNELIFSSKLFIGNCIDKDSTTSLIWLQSYRNEQNKFDTGMFIVDVYNGNKIEKYLKSQTIEFRDNLKILHNCHEIKGIEMTSEP